MKVLAHPTNTDSEQNRNVSRNLSLKSIVGEASEESIRFESKSKNYISAANTSANLADRMSNVLTSLTKAVSLMTNAETAVYKVLEKESLRNDIVTKANNIYENCEDSGIDSCGNCQLCFTNTYNNKIADCETCQGCIAAQCPECDKCQNCNTCQSCFESCVSCNSCQICYDSCNNYNYCNDCNSCQTICNSCQSTCYACQGCNDCQGCNKCERCDKNDNVCNLCVGCQSSCYGRCQTTCNKCQGTCNTCQICHTGCEHCDFCFGVSNKCKSCNSCQSENSCNNCDECQSCFSCFSCQSVCYTGCYVCDSGNYDAIIEEDLCGLSVGGIHYAQNS